MKIKKINMDLSDVTLASDDTDTNQNDTSNASDHNSSFKTPKRQSQILSGDISSVLIQYRKNLFCSP